MFRLEQGAEPLSRCDQDSGTPEESHGTNFDQWNQQEDLILFSLHSRGTDMFDLH